MTEEAPLLQRTFVNGLYKRIKRLAKELWIEDIAIMLVCMKCGKVVKATDTDPIHLLCGCRERIVR